MDTWSWLSKLPSAADWSPASPPHTFLLVSSSTKSILLKGERTAGSDPEAMATFSICTQGFYPSNTAKTLWISNPCPLPLTTPPHHLPLLLQLLDEVTALWPTPSPPLPSLDLQPTSTAFSNFFDLVLLSRLFHLCCASDASADVGALFFNMMDANIAAAVECREVVREVALSGGVDWEVGFARAVGYMLTKWCIVKELGVVGGAAGLPTASFFSYAADVHGLWVLRGYVPVMGMEVVDRVGFADLEAKEPLLRYALAHQQLEVVIQLEYSVCLKDKRFIRVNVGVSNIRVHVTQLGFRNKPSSTTDLPNEHHFPSRIQLTMGPTPTSPTSRHVSSLTLSKPTSNPTKLLQKEQTLKGKLSSRKMTSFSPKVKATSKTSTTETVRSWEWEQDAEGNAAVYDGVLRDGGGLEVVGGRRGVDMRGRSGKGLGRSGGVVVVGGEEVGEGVEWRVGRGLEGETVRWRLGGKVWVSYCANEVRSEYFETRCVEWSDEVDLELVQT